MRGCFRDKTLLVYKQRAFPADAGMFLSGFEMRIFKNRFPRVCGDVSGLSSVNNWSSKLSPRMRGCFYFVEFRFGSLGAFPAYAGMFLPFSRLQPHLMCFPRVCGDVSISHLILKDEQRLSPRMRGCFCQLSSGCGSVEAFPAYAGMFPAYRLAGQKTKGFPRVCGDVSLKQAKFMTQNSLSPRMRGCFRLMKYLRIRFMAFPAYAGMFPRLDSMYPRVRSFPRVCGDVSYPRAFDSEHSWLSPRMRGCFQWYDYHERDQRAFPAYAGMFPSRLPNQSRMIRFPRVCGDVSC